VLSRLTRLRRHDTLTFCVDSLKIELGGSTEGVVAVEDALSRHRVIASGDGDARLLLMLAPARSRTSVPPRPARSVTWGLR
jgi:hypothetical protein